MGPGVGRGVATAVAEGAVATVPAAAPGTAQATQPYPAEALTGAGQGLKQQQQPDGGELGLGERVHELLWLVLDSLPADLVGWSLQLLRLLHAADTFPRGGLYGGHYAAQAALRYELHWLPLLACKAPVKATRRVLVPPLDVAVAWLHHRLRPAVYERDCRDQVGEACQPRPEQAFRFAGQQAYRSCDTPEERDGWASRLAWDAATGQGGRSGGASGGGVPFWPPGAPGTQHDLTAHHPSGRGQAMPAQAAGPPAAGGGGAAAASEGGLAVELAGSMAGLCPLLHSLLRPAYLDPALLKQAVERYSRFLALHSLYPGLTLVPTTDVALMWVSHQAVPQAYRATCLKLFGAVWEAGPGVLQLDDEGPDYVETRRLYELHFGEVYDPPVTRPVPLSMPHPLLDSPLAPFLDFYDAGAAAPLGVRPDGATAACGQRCGAHVLYLAYLLGRGTSRSKRSLLGWVMGAGYRRRTSVRYVARKAEGFLDWQHLPHSDCHPYWRKLRTGPAPLAASGVSSGERDSGGGASASSAGVDACLPDEEPRYIEEEGEAACGGEGATYAGREEEGELKAGQPDWPPPASELGTAVLEEHAEGTEGEEGEGDARGGCAFAHAAVLGTASMTSSAGGASALAAVRCRHAPGVRTIIPLPSSAPMTPPRSPLRPAAAPGCDPVRPPPLWVGPPTGGSPPISGRSSSHNLTLGATGEQPSAAANTPAAALATAVAAALRPLVTGVTHNHHNHHNYHNHHAAEHDTSGGAWSYANPVFDESSLPAEAPVGEAGRSPRAAASPMHGEQPSLKAWAPDGLAHIVPAHSDASAAVAPLAFANSKAGPVGGVTAAAARHSQQQQQHHHHPPSSTGMRSPSLASRFAGSGGGAAVPHGMPKGSRDRPNSVSTGGGVLGTASPTSRHHHHHLHLPYRAGPPPGLLLLPRTDSAGTASPPGSAGSAARRRIPGSAGGSYTASDAAYYASLGQVASLVQSGDQSPEFATSLRERYSRRGSLEHGGAASPAGAPSSRRPSAMSCASAAPPHTHALLLLHEQ